MIRKVKPIFGENNASNSWTVKRLIDEFRSTGRVRESMTKIAETSIRHRAQEIDISTFTLHLIFTQD